MKSRDKYGQVKTKWWIMSAAVIITASILFTGCDFTGSRKYAGTGSEVDSYSNSGTLNITEDTNDIFGEFLPLN